MFTYIIVFCIISFCRTNGNRIMGDYDQLILAQHSPIASFFLKQNKTPDENNTIHDLVKNLQEYYIESLDPKHWIIDGLLPINFDGSTSTYCRTATNRNSIFINELLTEELIHHLKKNWPTLSENGTADDLWRSTYEEYGTCVSDYPQFYFEEAVFWRNRFNIGTILEKDQIVPGGNYSIGDIAASIIDEIEVDPSIKCLPSKNRREQYLLEVHICFDKARYLVNCHNANIFDCDPNHPIYYPGT